MSAEGSIIHLVSRATASVGSAGEAAALARYRAEGYRLIVRNWRCPLGELDLVLGRGRGVVFCEVKSRRGSALGGPFESVTALKQLRVRRLAEAFLISQGLRPEGVRFDVASVTRAREGGWSVHVFEDAF